MINEELIKAVAKKADEEIKFSKIIDGLIGTVAEMVDGVLIKGALTTLNKKFGPKIPPLGIAAIEQALEAFLADDYSNMNESVAELINEAIDIPYLDENEEGAIIAAVSDILFNLIYKRAGLME